MSDEYDDETIDRWLDDFTVEYVKRYNGEGWLVNLPHQCDAWQVVSCDASDPVPHGLAVARLTRFIEKAQAALEELKRRGEE